VTVGRSKKQRDECDVDKNGCEDDAGRKDIREIDAVGRSTCFVRLVAQLSK